MYDQLGLRNCNLRAKVVVSSEFDSLTAAGNYLRYAMISRNHMATSNDLSFRVRHFPNNHSIHNWALDYAWLGQSVNANRTQFELFRLLGALEINHKILKTILQTWVVAYSLAIAQSKFAHKIIISKENV